MAKDTDKIDKLDRKILSVLPTNVRIPFKGVVTQCDVSRVVIHQRVQRLVEKGIVTGSGFYVDPKSLGYSTCTYVGPDLERGSMYKKVVAEPQKILEVIGCHFTTSSYTMMIELYACDNEQLMDSSNNRMQTIPGAVSTETLISLRQSIKREIPVNVDEERNSLASTRTSTKFTPPTLPPTTAP